VGVDTRDSRECACTIPYLVAEDVGGKAISGRTARVISASRQSMRAIMSAIPIRTKMSSKIETTPDVNISWCVHIGCDTCDQTPHRFLSYTQLHVLQWRNIPCVDRHCLLAGPLHEVGLEEFKRKLMERRPYKAATCAISDHRISAEK